MKQEFEIPSGSPVAIPYKWETAPGRPIAEAVPVIPPWMSPLRPPPGIRRATKPSVSEFDGFAPEPPVIYESQLAGKVLKKMNRLRRKSVAAGACFTSEASRITQQSGRLIATDDLDRCNADLDAMSRSSTTFDPPSPPHYSTSVDSSFSEPFSGTMHSSSAGAAPSSPCSTSARPSSYCCFEDGEARQEDSMLPDDDMETLPGPSESAWHQPHGDEAPACIPQKFQMQRSYSSFVSTFLRKSAPSHSFKHLLFVRTFRKSKTAKQLDFGT